MSEHNYWQRMKRQQMSRRALLRASGRAGVGAAGLALVGCGDDDDDGQSQTVARQQAQQQQQQQAMQQQAEQQQQQQAMQQQQQEQQADQAADQADQQEQQQSVAQAQQQQQQQAAAPLRTYGGTLKFSTPAATHDFFDPHRGVFGPTVYWMGFYMNYLIRWANKEKGIMESDLASLPELPDEETYIFNIDRGATWWDQYPTEGGRAVNAQDIDINFDRQIAALDADGNPDARFRGQDAFRKTVMKEVADDQTFIARTDGPDATYLGGTILRPFSWFTSPEGIQEFGSRWRDETANIELSSGSGPFIPISYDPDIGTYLERNPNYWKTGADGQQLPYPDAVDFVNLTDPTAVDAAYRGQQIDIGGFPLSSVQVEELNADFPDHPFAEGAFGYTIVTVTGTYEPGWEGSDGLGNPYLDRRFAYAMHVAVDRDLLIDAVYLGAAKPSGTHYCPWFSTYWTIPADELRQFPGYRIDREADIQLCRELIDASGFDRDRTVTIYIPDIWETTYPGISETTRNMYSEAVGFNVELDLQPYTVMQDRFDNKTFPGRAPTWTNPPADLDPTAQFGLALKVGGASNVTQYNYKPVEDIIDKMTVTLDTEQRRDMAREVQRIGLGVDEGGGYPNSEHGLDGIFSWFGVMNGVVPTIWWPYVNRDEDTWQFAHDSHNHDETWLDTTHPQFQA